MLQLALDLALVHGARDRLAILVGKVVRQLEVDPDRRGKPGLWVLVGREREPGAGWIDAALLHEPQGEEAGASAKGREEQIVGPGRFSAATRRDRLVCDVRPPATFG